MAVFIKKVNIPQKSDLINIDMTGSGTAQTYRIIKKISDDVFEVLGMSDASTKAFDSNSTNTYAGKTLDTYLNSTWYNTLSATAKSAIVDKTFRQDSWYWGTQGNPDYQGKYSGDTAYQVSLDNASFGNEITRHIYAISVQDVIDYLEVTPQMTQADTTLTYDNVWTMFWNSTTTHSGNIWLRSARASSASYAFYVFGGGGRLGIDRASSSYAVRPAFQIDLSKIDYTFADGRQPVELKPVSVLQKSNNALSRVGMSYKVPEPMTSVSVSNASTSYYVAPAFDMRNTTSSFVVNGGTLIDVLYLASGKKPTSASETWEVAFSLKLNEALAGSFQITMRESNRSDMHDWVLFAPQISVVVLKNGEVAKTMTDVYYPTVSSTDFTTQAGDILTFQITATRP